MAGDLDETFPHRKNEDGTFGAICPHCFRTVASALLESELAQLEDEHVCDRNQLDRIDQLSSLGFLDETQVDPGRTKGGLSLIVCSQT
jgi:hypothetical protein